MPRNASQEAITNAFETLSRHYQTLSPEERAPQEELFKRMVLGHSILSDPTTRREYDHYHELLDKEDEPTLRISVFFLINWAIYAFGLGIISFVYWLEMDRHPFSDLTSCSVWPYLSRRLTITTKELLFIAPHLERPQTSLSWVLYIILSTALVMFAWCFLPGFTLHEQTRNIPYWCCHRDYRVYAKSGCNGIGGGDRKAMSRPTT